MSCELSPKRNPKICVYCAKNPGLTDDHVPPKSFFPQPRPSNLITVPACNKCNSGAGKDEDYFLATFMFSEAGITDAGKTLWKQRLDRMFRKNLGLRRRLAKGFSYRPVVTATGIYLGHRMGLQFDERRFERVIQKIVRGLYYFEYGEALSPETEIMTLFLSTKARFETAVAYANQLGWGKRQWPGIFEYRCGRVPGVPQESVWLMRCYSNSHFWAISGPDKALDKRTANQSLQTDR
jgi:hypothetical protein